MLATKAIIAKNTYNGAVPFYIKSILPYIKQLTFEPKHGSVRMNINAKCVSRTLLFTWTLELTLTRKRRSSRPFSYFRVQLKQQHYSAKKRHPIKHGLSSCIIGKFSFFLSRTCIVVSPSNATSMLLVISFALLCAIFVFYVTSSPCRPSVSFTCFACNFKVRDSLK